MMVGKLINLKQSNNQTRNAFSLSKFVTLAFVVLFLPFYVSELILFLNPFLKDDTWLRITAIPFQLLFVLTSILFFNHFSAYTLVFISSGLSITAYIKASSRSARVWLSCIWVLIMVLPLVHHYHPSLMPASNYEMTLVTYPRFWGNIVKTAQKVTEQRPCLYELLGWQDSNQLFYKKVCKERIEFWEYDALSSTSKRVRILPSLSSQNYLSKHEVLEMVRADGLWPNELEAITLPVLLDGNGLVSQDGFHTAIIAQHILGPQDIIVLTPIFFEDQASFTATQHPRNP